MNNSSALWQHPEESGPETGLSRAQVRDRLTGFGYVRETVNRAIDMAARTGTHNLAGYLVLTCQSDGPSGSFTISRRPDVSADGWQQFFEGRDWDVAEILNALMVVDRHLDEAAPPEYRDNPLANMWRRISAGPVSEAAEAVDAANGMTGGNPRKGVTHTQDDLLGELADTSVSGLLAIQSQTKDTARTWLYFLASLAKALNRVPEDRR